MTWKNVKLILSREIRDQLRDRRTLFMITVLPILLYPLLGMSFLQMAQFIDEQPSRVLIAGADVVEDREDLPPLFGAEGRFAPELFLMSDDAELLELTFLPEKTAGEGGPPVNPRALARTKVQSGEFDVAVYFPPDFADKLLALRGEPEADFEVPQPQILAGPPSDQTAIARVRVRDVLDRWSEEIGKKNLEAAGVPARAAKPFEPAIDEPAETAAGHDLIFWSKILPVLLLVWALTGAFYPAIDLCAGEKERGTLETLLSSPAERSEIVVGKLVTVMLFSMVTAVLNLASMGLTGWLILGRLEQFGAPPVMAVVWLAIALVPVSALFSALCIALAAFAKSTKEGQYYLMPLLLVTLPLVILPMAPSVELNLGNSLIPITGLVLLLKSLLVGSYWQAVQFLPPVVAVTLACCLLAIRWAVDQFNSESVLFREGERLDVALWLRHLVADRRPTPTVAAAVFCGVAILVIRFYLGATLPAPVDFVGFAKLAAITQLVVVLLPAVLMTVLFTTSPRRTLLLKVPHLLTVPGAVLLAVLLHPAAIALQTAITRLYPINEETAKALEDMLGKAPGVWSLVLLLAVLPGLCEELAFRGFILSGFRHLGHKWRAIFFSALFFGVSHGILQQSIAATILGTVIGYLAVQSGSILPGMAFHMVHNTLAVAAAKLLPELTAQYPLVGRLVVQGPDGSPVYHWLVVLVPGLFAAAILWWFQRLPYHRSAEERHHDALVKAWQAE